MQDLHKIGDKICGVWRPFSYLEHDSNQQPQCNKEHLQTGLRALLQNMRELRIICIYLVFPYISLVSV